MAARNIMSSVIGRALPLFTSLNKFSQPFLSDDGTGEDDYALLPPPKPLGVIQLMAITFFAVSGSAFGIEETVSAAGPLLALSCLLIAAICWSAPMAMVRARVAEPALISFFCTCQRC